MKNKFENIVLVILVIANVIVVAESLLDYKTDRLLDVNSNSYSNYIYSK